MTIYATLTLIMSTNSHQTIDIGEKDHVEVVEGGFEVRFESSPSTTTFYPFHRVWEYKEINTTKLPGPDKDSFYVDPTPQQIKDSTIGGVRNVTGNVQL